MANLCPICGKNLALVGRSQTACQGALVTSRLLTGRCLLACTRIFSEQVSSVARRAQLEAAVDYLRDGDVLIVTKLDRLARSMRDLLEIITRVEAKGAGLRILAMNLDTTTATGRLIMTSSEASRNGSVR